MEVGTQVWCWDDKGCDVGFPDDPEACGAWRTARISRIEIDDGQLVFTAAFTDGKGGEWRDTVPLRSSSSDGARAETATKAGEGGILGSNFPPGLKRRNLRPGVSEVVTDSNAVASLADEEIVEDLITLPHLHEPAILCNLAARYANDAIYTMTGPILLAVNPFQRLGDRVYGPDVVAAYREAGEGGSGMTVPPSHSSSDSSGSRSADANGGSEQPSLGPHVFLLADAAYRVMASKMSESTIPFRDRGSASNQSILVSGESGAGKTETTKFIMSYLAAVAQTAPTGEVKAEFGRAGRQSIEQQVLQSNPILESFGNARTVRNDNSSRFGKFIEIHFKLPLDSSARPVLAGASIQTYLLEKVRLISQSPKERNYHIFYEVCAGCEARVRRALSIPDISSRYDGEDGHCGTLEEHSDEEDSAQEEKSNRMFINDFNYLNQSNCFHRRDGIRDRDQFYDMMEAMRIIGLGNGIDMQDSDTYSSSQGNESTPSISEGSDQRLSVLRVVAALLYLGNVRFENATDGQDSASDGATTQMVVDSSSKICARLLGVKQKELSDALCKRQMTSGAGATAETLTVFLQPEEAEYWRDAAVKVTYNELFLWLVTRVNASLERKQHEMTRKKLKAPRKSPSGKPRLFKRMSAAMNDGVTESILAEKQSEAIFSESFIGVLDIFGFESFQTNSFEQLCINFCNEKLQQQFNGFVFKLEQAEYEQESILWSFVDFPDNSECLDLIEGRHKGVFALLDEQCILIKTASGESFASKLYEFCDKHPRFRAGAVEKREKHFVIRHYAGDVIYDCCTGFLEKNVDKFNPLMVDLLLTSRARLLRTLGQSVTKLMNPDTAGPSSSESKASRRTSIGSKSKATSVSSQFRSQLASLLEVIAGTRPHYIRCLKPNDRNEPHFWHGRRILHQLRCGGVLEAVRVSRAGYPNRLQHKAFLRRYDCICKYSLFVAKNWNSSGKRSAGYVALQKLSQEMSPHYQKSNSYSDIDALTVCEIFLKFLVPPILCLCTLGPLGASSDLLRDVSPRSHKEPQSAVRELRNVLLAIILMHEEQRGGMADMKVGEGGGQQLPLVEKSDESSMEKATTQKELKEWLATAGMQCGKTKVFFRANSFGAIEHLRSSILRAAATVIQSLWRAWKAWDYYFSVRRATVILQCATRQTLALKEFLMRRATRASIMLQAASRRRLAVILKQRALWAICRTTAIWRGKIARRKVQQLRKERCATTLAAWARQRSKRQAFCLTRRGILAVQCKFRAKIARLRLRELRIQSRSLGKAKEECDNLRAQLAEMTLQLEKANSIAALVESSSDLESERLRMENEKLKQELVTKAAISGNVNEQLEAERTELKVPMKIKAEDTVKYSINSASSDTEKAQLKAENDKLKQQVEIQERHISSLTGAFTGSQSSKLETSSTTSHLIELQLTADSEELRTEMSDSSTMQLLNLDELNSTIDGEEAGDDDGPGSDEDEDEDVEEIFVSNAVITSFGAKNKDKAAERGKTAVEVIRLQESIETENGKVERLEGTKKNTQLEGLQDLLSQIEHEYSISSSPGAAQSPLAQEFFSDTEPYSWSPGVISPIHIAVAMGDAMTVERILSLARKTLLIDPPDYFGNEPGELTLERRSTLAASHVHLLDGMHRPRSPDANIDDDYLARTLLGKVLTAVDGDRRTALHVAAKAGHARIVQILLVAAGAADGPEQYAAAVSVVKQAAVAAGELMYPQPIDLNVYPWRVAADSRLLQVQENGRMSQAALIADLPDLRGDTAIHLVREASTAEALLSGGACPNLRNNEGATALHTAVRRREEVAHEHLAVIQRRRGRVILPKQRSSFPDQQAALIIALLKGGADPNAIERHHAATPLHLAVASGRLALVKNLFVASRTFLDVDLRDHDGNSALHLCCHFAGLRSRMLQSFVAMHSPPHLAISGPEVIGPVVRNDGAVSDAGGRVYAPMLEMSPENTTFDAATIDEDKGYLLRDELNILQLLLSHGADVNAINCLGQRPLHILCANPNLQGLALTSEGFVASILGSGADPSAKGALDRALPLHAAAQRRDLALCKVLVNAGAELNDVTPARIHFPLEGNYPLSSPKNAVSPLGGGLRHDGYESSISSPSLSASAFGSPVRPSIGTTNDSAFVSPGSYGSRMSTDIGIGQLSVPFATDPELRRLANSPAKMESSGAYSPSLSDSARARQTGRAVAAVARDNGRLSPGTAKSGGEVYIYDLDGPRQDPAFLEGILAALEAPPRAVPDSALKWCMECKNRFGTSRRRHHCRFCGRLLCHACSSHFAPPACFPPSFHSKAGGSSVGKDGHLRLMVDRTSKVAVRVCRPCHAVLTLGVGFD